MSERPTPITDDHVNELRRNPEVSGCNRTLEFARNLERQLGTVTDAFNEQVNRRHNLERQLAEAQAQLRIADEQLALERGALAEAREQRDALAEALKKACAHPVCGNWYEEAQSALDALKETTPEP